MKDIEVFSPVSLEEIRYTIPYEWGQLRVTDEAMDAFHLIPLVSGVHDGLPPKEPHDQPQIIITIVGPNKIAKHAIDGVSPSLVSSINVSEGSRPTDVVVAATESVADIIKRLKSDLTMHLDIDLETTETMVNHEGRTIDDFVGTEFPQDLAHNFALVAASECARAELYRRNKVSERLIKKQSKLNTIATVGSVALAGSVNVMTGQSDQSISVWLLGLFTAIQTASFFINQKRIEKKDVSLKLSNSIASVQFGDKVHSDIHEAFCRNAFEERMSE